MSQVQLRKPGMSLQAFASQEGLTKSQALYLAKRGRIMGACKGRNGDWLVFPPAKLTEPLRKRTTWRDREANESAAASPAVDFGTSPHGLSADLRRPLLETLRSSVSHSLADGFEGLGLPEIGNTAERNVVPRLREAVFPRGRS